LKVDIVDISLVRAYHKVRGKCDGFKFVHKYLWTNLLSASMKHFTLESTNPHSIPEKNVPNSQTFYFNTLKRF